MFSLSKVSSEEKRFFYVQQIGIMINTLAEKEPDAEQLFYLSTQIQGLKDLGFITHDATKNKRCHSGTKVSDYNIPLVFLAVMYNNKHVFNLLTHHFGFDIAVLKDDMPGHKKNIIHHMFGQNSLADIEIQNLVFECLEYQYTPETILKMINEQDARGVTALAYAQSYGFGIEMLSERMTKYQDSLRETEEAQAYPDTLFAQPIRRMESLEACATLSAMHLTTLMSAP